MEAILRQVLMKWTSPVSVSAWRTKEKTTTDPRRLLYDDAKNSATRRRSPFCGPHRAAEITFGVALYVRDLGVPGTVTAFETRQSIEFCAVGKSTSFGVP